MLASKRVIENGDGRTTWFYTINKTGSYNITVFIADGRMLHMGQVQVLPGPASGPDSSITVTPTSSVAGAVSCRAVLMPASPNTLLVRHAVFSIRTPFV